MKEIIKRFEDTKIYVSNYGKAFRLEDGCIVEATLTRSSKKLTVGVGNGLAGRMNLDSLVWRTFNGTPDGFSKLHIQHKDGDIDNNRLDNLEMPQLRKKTTVVIRADKYQELLDRLEALEANQKAE